jgi:hypothetical protein
VGDRRRPAPNTQLPDPNAKSTWSLNYSRAGVDTSEIIIRGGSHLDFSFIPNQAFGASLRGADEIAWYTTAWFDRYLRGDPGADARLLTERWRDDPTEAGVDPNGDGNAFSFYYWSRLDIHLAGGQAWDCEDLRAAARGWSPTTDIPVRTRTWRSTRARTAWSVRAPPCGARAACPRADDSWVITPHSRPRRR